MTKARILIVDNNKTAAVEMQSRLNGLGYEIVSLVDSEEDAVLSIENTHPDLVLIDMMVNGKMDGIQFAQRIRVFSDVPVVYLMNNLNESVLERAKITEPYRYVIKPFEDHDLAVAIEITLYKCNIDRKAQQSDSRCRDFHESLPQSVFEIDLCGNFTYANRLGLENTGYTHEDINSGLNVLKLFIPEQRTRVTKNIQKLIKGEKLKNIEYTALIKDGSTFPILVYTNLISSNNQPTGIRGIVVDITDIRTAEKEIHRRDCLLSSISVVAQILLDSNNVDIVFPIILRILGEATEVSRAYVFENEMGDNGDLLTTQRFEWVDSGISSQIDNPAFQKLSYESAGFQRWVSILSIDEAIYGAIDQFPVSEKSVLASQDIISIIAIPVFLSGGWWGFIGFDDCSTEHNWTTWEVEALRSVANIIGAALERERVEVALRESHNRIIQTKKEWECTVDSLRQIVCLLDNQGRIIRVNRTIETWNQTRVTNIKGRSLHELLHPDCSDQNCPLYIFSHKAWNELKEGRSSVYEAADGILKRHISIYIKPIQFQQKRSIQKSGSFAVAVVDDISEHVQAEKNLIKAKEEWERTFNTVQDLIMVIDRNWLIMRVNKAMAERLGRTQEECKGLYFNEYINVDHESLTDYPRSKLLVNERQLFTGLNSHSLDDHFSVIISPMYDADGIIEGSVLIARDITAAKQSEKELQSSREQLRNLTAHLQSIREEERKHVAREIHDELGQVLTALKMDLHWLNKRLPENQESLRERADTMSHLIDNIIEVVQRISYELRPGLLDDLGLVSAIEWQANQFQKRTGIECDLYLDSVDSSLNEDQITAIFRICQEALTNIMRHANAKNTIIYLNATDEMLKLVVCDDGKGITEKCISDSASLGLIGIRERVRSLGGKVIVTGEPDNGTMISVLIPLDRVREGTEE